MLDRRLIERLCRQHHYSWRNRELDPATTIALFMQQILHGNIPCSEVRHIAGGGLFPVHPCAVSKRDMIQFASPAVNRLSYLNHVPFSLRCSVRLSM